LESLAFLRDNEGTAALSLSIRKIAGVSFFLQPVDFLVFTSPYVVIMGALTPFQVLVRRTSSAPFLFWPLFEDGPAPHVAVDPLDTGWGSWYFETVIGVGQQSFSSFLSFPPLLTCTNDAFHDTAKFRVVDARKVIFDLCLRRMFGCGLLLMNCPL